jgi:hypothetical protein
VQIDLVKGMMDCLYAECKPCITDCVMAELEKLGQKYRVALKVAKVRRALWSVMYTFVCDVNFEPGAQLGTCSCCTHGHVLRTWCTAPPSVVVGVAAVCDVGI